MVSVLLKRGGCWLCRSDSNIIMGFQARAALTVNGYYGSKNPSCKSESKPVRDTRQSSAFSILCLGFLETPPLLLLSLH